MFVKWHHSYDYFEGNLSTLKTIPESRGIVTRDELLKFHKDLYSANIMSLVVIGKGKNISTAWNSCDSFFMPIWLGHILLLLIEVNEYQLYK